MGKQVVHGQYINYNATDNIFSDGESGAFVGDFNGYTKTTSPHSFLNIGTVAAANTTVKSGAGVLHAIVVNTVSTVSIGTVSAYDGLAVNGTRIANITIPTTGTPFTVPYNVAFSTGLVVSVSSSANVTVIYR